MTINQLKEKKIAVVGLGVNNTKLAEYLKKKAVDFDIIDGWKNLDELATKLTDYQVIFRTPGLPYLSKPIQKAKEIGVEVTSQTKLFFELCPSRIIGVTGTKGKGTTSSLIAKILSDGGIKTWLAGNIGSDPFEFLDEIKPEDYVVLELSSFQLQDMTVSPNIAVVLNITVDHLDHHLSVEEYVSAKSSILSFQTHDDSAVVSDLLGDNIKNLGEGKKYIFKHEEGKAYQTRLLGEHNFYNIAAAVKVAQILNVPEESIKKSVAEFEGLPHRLKIVSNKNGIKYVDDSFSTNPDTSLAALKSFNENIALILGGYDKGLEYGELVKYILAAKNVKGIVLIGEVAFKIRPMLSGYQGKLLEGATNMKEIITQAESIATSGDVILLSPAAASFDMFVDYKDRGDQFIQLSQ